MDSRKSLIDVGIYNIKDARGKTYKIDKKYSVRYGGSALIYHVEAEGRNYMLKECYPNCLADKLERKFDGCLSLSGNSFLVDIEDEEVFESFKQLALKEHETITSISKSRKYFKSKNDFIYASNTPFEANGTIYTPIETTDSISLAEKIESWEKDDFSTTSLKEIFQVIEKLLYAAKNLHDNGFLHLDICPDNIVISNADVVRLIDFNSSCQINRIMSNHRFSFKEGYSAIELRYRAKGIEYGKITKSTDIYSIGSILFRIFCGRTITTFDKSCSIEWEEKLGETIQRFNEIDEYDDIKEELIKIIKKSTSNDHSKRYKNAKEMLRALNSLTALVYMAPFKKIISNLTDTISQAKTKLKITRRKLFISVGILIIGIASLVSYNVYLPNIKDAEAYELLENGNAKEAYEQMLEVYNIYMSKPRLLHPFYSEEKLNTLAWHIYQQRTLETTVEFEENVIQAVKTHDNNQIIALLENSKIVAKNLSVNITPANSFSVPNTEGLLSSNGMYYATINNNAVLEVYHIGNKKLYEFENVENFALDNNYLLIYANGSFEAISLDTRETISYDYLTLESVPTKYSSNAKTIDYKMQQNMMSYIDTLGNVIVINLTTGKKYIHTPETKKALKFVQLSENVDFSTVQVSDLDSVVYEFDYITNEKALALSTLEYSYFASPESNWKISQKWTDETSLEDRYISIEDNKVKVNLIATDTTTRIRFMKVDGNAEKEVTKLADCGDVMDSQFYIDYDRQTNQFYLTNIETGAERILPLKSDSKILEIAEFVIHDDSLCVATKDSIIFCKIDNNSIREQQRITFSDSYSDEIYYSFSPNKKMLVCLEGKTLKIYKYIKSWELYDTFDIPDGFVYNIKVNHDNSKLCISIQHPTTNKLIFLEDTISGFKQYSLEMCGEFGMHISDDMRHAFALFKAASTEDNLNILSVDFGYKKNGVPKHKNHIIERNIESVISEYSQTISGSHITVFSESEEPLYPRYILFNNKKSIVKNGVYAVSRPIQVSKEEIAYIERNDNKDSLVKYNVENDQKTIIPLPKYGLDNPPNTYDLWFLKDGYISVAALYCEVENNMIKECLCVNYLFEDLELDKLLLKCENLYR